MKKLNIFLVIHFLNFCIIGYFQKVAPRIGWVQQLLRLHRGTFITHTQRMLVCQIFPPWGENGKTGDIALPAPSELQISAAQKPKPDPKPPRQSRGSLNQIEPQRTPVFLTFSLRGAAVSGRRSVGGVYN